MRDLKTLGIMFRQLKYVMTEKQRKQIVGILFLIIVGALFEMLGVSAILPFIQSIMQPESLTDKWYIEVIITIFNLKSANGVIFASGIFIIIIYLIKNIFLFISSRVQSLFRCRFQKDLSVKLLHSYLKRPYVFFLDVNSSEIIRTVSADVFGVFQILQNICKVLSEVFALLAISLYTIYIDPFMAVGIFLIAGICFVTITLFFKNRLSMIGQMQREANAEKQKWSYQAITGYKEVQVMQRADCFVEAYEEAFEKQRAIEVEFETISAMPERIIEFFCIAGLILVVCLRLAMGGAAEDFIPNLSIFAVAAFRILPSVSHLTGYVNSMVFYRPTLEGTYEALKEVDEYQKSIQGIINDSVDSVQGETYCFKDKVTVSNIYWKYPKTDRYVLNNLSIDIEKGDSVAFIGASGAGKTTLADIILGLLRPEKGTVKIDDIEIAAIPHMWSRIIGYVPQVVFLTDDTVRNNIAFGIRGDDIDDDKIWNALEQAQLKDFVQGLPNGLETVVGERGVKFSGGQKQRIAIARALYYNPAILVLDEATSALDNETENAVMESIEVLQGHKTLIIVAHRLTTIRKCNKIYEIADGHAILRNKEDVLNGEN